jgi:hypothetical protein
MNTNAKLSVVAVALLAGSLWIYTSSESRADRFQRGQRFLPNLSPDEIATIVVSKGDETVTLRKAEDGFTVDEVHDYPARNEAINRFLRDLIEIGLEKEVGRGEDLAADLEIEPPGDDTAEVALLDINGDEMVRLRIGKRFEDGAGNYAQRLDLEEAPIYLTSETTVLSTGVDAFLRKEIVDVPQSDVMRVSGNDILIEAEGGEQEGPLHLVDVPRGKKEISLEINKLTGLLDRFSFDGAFLADDPEVAGLAFERSVRLDLVDGTSYIVALGTKGERSFVTVQGDHDLDRVEITLDTPEDELREKADQLTRADEIEAFNTFHGSWVYEISQLTADKLSLQKSDLVEDAT